MQPDEPFSNDIFLLICYPLPILTCNFKGHLNGIAKDFF